MASPVVVVKEPDSVCDDVVVIYSLLVWLVVVVIDSVSFVVLIKIVWLVALLDLVVTTSFVVVKVVYPVAGVCHVINVNVGLPKQYQHILYKHNITYVWLASLCHELWDALFLFFLWWMM